MQAAGDLVGPATELTSGVQGGHYGFQCCFSCSWMDIDGDTPTIIDNRDYPFGVQRNFHRIAEASHGLIDRVIKNFVNQVMQTALVGAADVHPGADSDRFQSLKNLDIFRSVVGIGLLHHMHNSYKV